MMEGKENEDGMSHMVQVAPPPPPPMTQSGAPLLEAAAAAAGLVTDTSGHKRKAPGGAPGGLEEDGGHEAKRRVSRGESINLQLSCITIAVSCIDRLHRLHDELLALASGVCGLKGPLFVDPMGPTEDHNVARKIQVFLNASPATPTPTGVYNIIGFKYEIENYVAVPKLRVQRYAPYDLEQHYKEYDIDRASLCATCDAAAHFINGGLFSDRDLSALNLSKPGSKLRRYSCSRESTLWWRWLAATMKKLPKGKVKFEDREDFATAQSLLMSQCDLDPSLSRHLFGPLKRLRDSAGVKGPLSRAQLREEQDKLIFALDAWLEPVDPAAFVLDDDFLDRLHLMFKEHAPSWLEVINSSMALNNDSRNVINTRLAKVKRALLRLVAVFQQRSERELMPWARLVNETTRGSIK
ncbi:Hypothetical Protein FCC1311_064482 [Hondaea fermentalgiana]|uniref:Uncharacterized protein n=1 Tax=Hondaea fermentalgiana TaxID=2315210 RepID=A0A2R5GKH2_9STRA|nr:Hypothetical Protein FCC1311_064482 [Hondaea fermentalgiana]|eukprot:GBG30228.1 Hypothetical Protein FCC1311_064482 [Hondaea fermentalgiana]